MLALCLSELLEALVIWAVSSTYKHVVISFVKYARDVVVVIRILLRYISRVCCRLAGKIRACSQIPDSVMNEIGDVHERSPFDMEA